MVMKDQFINVPPDVLPVVNRIVSELNKLTVLDQQDVLAMFVVRHIVRRSHPEAVKVSAVLAEMLASIVAATSKAVEENHVVRKDKR